MIDAGALVYYNIAKDLAHIAGVYEHDDWYVIDERANRFKGLLNDEYGNNVIAELVGFISLSSQQGSEYHMAKHSGARGEMWSTIPYSVLSDAEWTPTLGPLRAASSTLPAKTALYTTTRGKLTQDECNALARGFTPAALAPEFRYLDDTWVKNHVGGIREPTSCTGAPSSTHRFSPAMVPGCSRTTSSGSGLPPAAQPGAGPADQPGDSSTRGLPSVLSALQSSIRP